jgi:HK97 gp10 family phage protein
MADDFKFSIGIEGGKELYAALGMLTPEIERRVEQKSLAEAGRMVRDKAKQLCPVAKAMDADEILTTWRVSGSKGGKLSKAIPGLLRDSIKVISGKKKRNFVNKIIGTAAGWFKGQTFYGGIVEFGGTLRANYKAQPFIRPAFDSQTNALTEKIVTGVNTGLMKIWMNRPGYSEEGTIS